MPSPPPSDPPEDSLADSEPEPESDPEISPGARHAAVISVAVSAFVLSSILLISYALSLSVGAANPGIVLVNIFGMFIALSILFLSFYLQFGPRVSIPFTPVREPPVHVPISLFVLGCGILLTNLRFASGNYYAALFWRVVGYSILLSLATALAAAFAELKKPDWMLEEDFTHERDRDSD